MKRLMTLFIGFMLMVGFVFAEKSPFLKGLGRPESINIDKDRIIVTEGTNIFIYSLKDNSLLKKFGREGEGPQEFKRPPNPMMEAVNVVVRPDDIMVNSTGKISYFTKDGEFIKEIKTTSLFGRFKPLGDRFVGFSSDVKDGKRYITVNFYSPQMEKDKELTRRETGSQEGKKIDPIKMSTALLILGVQVWDDKIFYLGDDQGIQVFDKAGNKLHTIQYPYEQVSVSQERKDRYINFLSTDYRFKPVYEQDKSRIEFPPYFPLVRDFRVVDNKVYVLTFKEKDGKKEVIIFDCQGKLQEKIFLPIQEQNAQELFPYTLYQGKLYQLIENPKEDEWDLQITEIK